MFGIGPRTHVVFDPTYHVRDLGASGTGARSHQLHRHALRGDVAGQVPPVLVERGVRVRVQEQAVRHRMHQVVCEGIPPRGERIRQQTRVERKAVSVGRERVLNGCRFRSQPADRGSQEVVARQHRRLGHVYDVVREGFELAFVVAFMLGW